SAGVCDRPPNFLSPSGDQTLGPPLGSVVTLNCTAWVVSTPQCPLLPVQWLKDGQPLGNGSHYDLHEDSWVKANLSEVLVSSVLGVNLTSAEDYGAFTCSVQNVSSASFTLWRAAPAGHLAAVLASLLVLLALLLAALLYLKCRLNVQLWYQNAYGEVEMNDGKLYDAYVSYSDSPDDRKFVNFILKPQLERCRGYKLFLDDRDLLPRAELQLALPRKVQYRAMEGDPQTRLQDDKDPMLIVRGHVPEGRTLDPELDPDPEGDLGVRGPVFGEPSATPHASRASLGEGRGSEVDVSDLGSRNYSARTDFYCLVSKDDM
ncbi:Single Ig IL-1-related receptor, partial [Myotis brandtii]